MVPAIPTMSQPCPNHIPTISQPYGPYHGTISLPTLTRWKPVVFSACGRELKRQSLHRSPIFDSRTRGPVEFSIKIWPTAKTSSVHHESIVMLIYDADLYQSIMLGQPSWSISINRNNKLLGPNVQLMVMPTLSRNGWSVIIVFQIVIFHHNGSFNLGISWDQDYSYWWPRVDPN